MTLEVTATVANPAPANFFIDFTFDWLDEGDISVYKNGSATAMARSTWKFITRERIEVLSGNFAADDSFKLLRETQVGSSAVTFVPGASIRAQDLNQNQQQVRFVSEELNERSVKATGGSMTGNLEMDDSDIVIQEGDDEVTITAPTLTADRTLTIPDTTGTIVTTGDNNTVTTTMVDGSLVNANIAADAEIAVSKLADGTARQLLQTSADPGNDVEWTSNVDVPGTLDVTGNTTLDGNLEVVGTVTFTDDTDNTLGSENTGSVQFDGGVGIAKNLTVKVDLDVDGTANLDVVDIDGAVDLADNTTTAAGTDLRIQDNNAASFQVSEGTNAYMTFDTTTNARRVETNQILDIQQGWEISGTTVDVTAAELNLLDDRTISGATISTDNNVRQNELPTTQAIVAWVEDQLDAIDGFVAVATRTDFPDTQPPENVVVSVGDMDDLAVDQNGQATNATTDNGTAVTITGIEANFRPTSGTRDVDAGVRMLVISTGANQTYSYHKATLKESDLINLSNDINDFGNRYRVSGTEPDTDEDNGDLWWDSANNQLNAYNGTAWAPVTASGEFIRLLLRDTDGTAPTFDGNVRDYNLVREDDTSVAGSITTAQQLLLSVDGVMQRPNPGTSIGTDADDIGFCRVDADTIQLAGAPEAGAQVFAIQMGTATEINTPAEDSVDSQHYVDDSIDSQHLNSTTGSEAVTTDVIRDNAVGADALASDADDNNNADRAVTTDHIRTDAVTQAKIADEAIDEARLQVSNAPTDGRFLQAQSGNTGGLTWAEVPAPATADADLFDADGTQTDYAIDAGHTVHSILVIVNGLVMRPSHGGTTRDYTVLDVSGTNTLRFETGQIPANNAEIDIRYLPI